MKKLILRTFIFISLFLVFNINEIDSNSDKILYYDSSDIHVEDAFKVYLKDTNSSKLNDVLKILNIDVLNYIIEDEKYYARNIDDLIERFTKNKTLEEKIYYELKGVKVDAVTIYCEVDELMKFENLVKTY